MQKIDSSIALRAAIISLEVQQADEGKILKQEFHLAYESMKPLNLIKSTFKEAMASEEVKDTVVNTSVGLAAGYLSKVLFEGVTHGPLRKLLGTVLMFGITNTVAKHPEAVRSLGKNIFKMLVSKSNNSGYGHGIGGKRI